MKILMHSIAGDGVTLSQQCAQEGHDVQLYLADKSSKLYDGLLWKTQDWEKAAGQADLVIFDGNGMGGRAEHLRERGIKVWNGSKLADALEKDRAFGMKVFEKAGIQVPETFRFKSGKEALEILGSQFKPADRMVIKLDDFGACATSYVARDHADMDAQIHAWEDDPKLARIDKGGILQRFIEGVELSIEGWFNGERFMRPFNVTMEDKPLLNGGKGPNTGCSQNIVWQLRAESPKLSRMILPLEKILRAGHFRGQIDVNTIVAEDGSGAYALEFTPRPGYDATPTLIQGLSGYGEACMAAVSGEDKLPLSARPFDFLAAVRVWIPPYPYESTSPKFNEELYSQIKGVPIEGWSPERRDILLCDAMADKDGKIVVSGAGGGIPYIALGKASSIEAAAAACYKALDSMHVPNQGYRLDCGERALEGWETVVSWVKG